MKEIAKLRVKAQLALRFGRKYIQENEKFYRPVA